MKSIKLLTFLGVAVAFVAACVTINVYFPEAAADQAADRFIDNVIGSDEGDGEAPPTDDGASAFHLNPLDWIFPAAHAQANIDINTPAVRAIQDRMATRFEGDLKGYFGSGVIGLTNDALVAIRDQGAVPLSERNRLKALVKAENDDRRAVYREIAVANGHPEWESQIRATFAERWVVNAPGGWYYQNAGGGWVQK